MSARERDRPPVPGTLPFGTKVIVRAHGGEYHARVQGARAGVTGAMLLVRSGGNSHWVERSKVRAAPPPWTVRAVRWVKSFLFGES